MSVSTRMAEPKKHTRHRNRPMTMTTMMYTMGRHRRSSRKSMVKGTMAPSYRTSPVLRPLTSIR